MQPCPAGVGDEGSLPQREFAYYPRLTAMSSMYPDEADAAAAVFSLVLHRPQSFSLLEDVAKALARCAQQRQAAADVAGRAWRARCQWRAHCQQHARQRPQAPARPNTCLPSRPQVLAVAVPAAARPRVPCAAAAPS